MEATDRQAVVEQLWANLEMMVGTQGTLMGDVSLCGPISRTAAAIAKLEPLCGRALDRLRTVKDMASWASTVLPDEEMQVFRRVVSTYLDELKRRAEGACPF
jgi:hypothetical protein